MYKIMIYLILIGLLCSCTINKITREYHVTIDACEGSQVYFDPEVLADIKKKSETDTQQTTDIQTDADASLY